MPRQLGTGATGAPIYDYNVGTVDSLLFRHLDTSGNGTGSKNANGDYRPVPTGSGQTIFFIQPESHEVYRIERIIVRIRNGAVDVGTYGEGMPTGLPSGIQVRIQNDSTTKLDLIDGLPVMAVDEWQKIGFETKIQDQGSGDDVMYAELKLKDLGGIIRLVGEDSERLEFVLNDNFSSLTDQFFIVQGRVESSGEA